MLFCGGAMQADWIADLLANHAFGASDDTIVLTSLRQALDMRHEGALSAPEHDVLQAVLLRDLCRIESSGSKHKPGVAVHSAFMVH